jgi:hypothetical protein
MNDMITLHIDGTEFVLRPDNAENVRLLCASIKAKGKGRKFKPGKPGLDMTRQFPVNADSTAEYVGMYEMLNYKIFGSSNGMKRWAPLNTARTTHYDPTQPICAEE